MSETIWITRTLPAAHKSAQAFAHLGLAAAIAPLLLVSPPEDMPAMPPQEALLIFTSANGLSAFCELTDERHWPVVTVGAETAVQARKAGFENVSSADGTSDDVTALVKASASLSTPIIHCAGVHVRGSITQDLRAAGYQARRDLYYRSAPVETLPKIDLSKLNYLALYSPLTAKTLASFKLNLSTVTILSISAATDAALGDLKAQSRLIAKAPNEAAMLDLLAPQKAV